MFYRPEDGHGLPHSPFNAIVTPRPIGWISSRGADGSDNLAPYSFFNALSYVPPQVMFSIWNCMSASFSVLPHAPSDRASHGCKVNPTKP